MYVIKSRKRFDKHLWIIIEETIVKKINEYNAFSLLADETVDISGKEEISPSIN